MSKKILYAQIPEISLQLLPILCVLLIVVFQLVSIQLPKPEPKHAPLASRSMSLENRWPNKWVSNVFKDNILLTSAYLAGKADKNKPVDWNTIQKPFSYEFTLKPNQVFAFHDDVLPAYRGSVVKTTNAHYSSYEGFKSDGFLVGDGVCHLASLFYWAAKDAKLDTVAPVNHDFAPIAEIPKQYGVAIYSASGESAVSETQNLYIKNNKNKPVTFELTYDGTRLSVAVVEKG